MTTEPKITMRCSRCGGANVLRDAYAQWSDEAQQWELSSTFDDAICDDCGGEARIDEYALADAPPVDEDGKAIPETEEEA